MNDEGKQSDNIPLMLESSIYFVATHYKISIPDVLAMSPEEFEQSFVWGVAAKQLEGDEIEKASAEMKGGTRIGSTNAGQPFPYE